MLAGLQRRSSLVRVRLCSSRRDIWIRAGTTDLNTMREVWAGGEYDLPITAPATILDGGAHIGLTSVFFTTKWPGVRVLAVEPASENFELLVRNTRGLGSIEVLNAALWSNPAELVLRDPGRGHSALMIPESQSACAIEITHGVTVSELFDSRGWCRIGLLKLDIEASEIEVLSFSSDWIERVDTLAVELHDRLRPGCTRIYREATERFPHRISIGRVELASRTSVSN
ncbi:MAG TPA: FkbM family methyltransferase [Gaiellaceae bacterium]|nr:FkbM family methyltransferase [Gaiellaceae bacterium]